MRTSPAFVTLLPALGLPQRAADTSPAAETRRGYALAEVATRLASVYAGRNGNPEGARIAALAEVVDEETATAANHAIRACFNFQHHEVLNFAACATAAATDRLPGAEMSEKRGKDIAFYLGRLVENCDERLQSLARELVARVP